ncbi:cytochrome c peroxidase [Isosphaeraceae bacterium EP7]
MISRLRTAATLVALATPALVYVYAPARAAQDAPSSREPTPSAVHLVGHEDDVLLRRVQDVIDDWDPRKLRNPYVDTLAAQDRSKNQPARKSPRRRDLGDFIADFDAAEALGKAFFWEMKAGSDFRRENQVGLGTACASCHYRYGADARDTHTTRVPFVAWDQYDRDNLHEDLGFNEKPRPFPVAELARKPIKADDLYLPRRRQRHIVPRADEAEDNEEEDDFDDSRRTPLSLIVGSQGVEPRKFLGLNPDPGGKKDWTSERNDPKTKFVQPNWPPEWAMFMGAIPNEPKKLFRQITPRNSPSVINSGFSERLFHDGRAESTFNGFSIFGDADDQEILHLSNKPGAKPVPVRVAISRAALASQAVGPVVNDLEMSYEGRTFNDLAKKLLDAEVLGDQTIDVKDSILGVYLANKLVGPGSSYKQLIRLAFRREWWDDSDGKGGNYKVPLKLTVLTDQNPNPAGSLMEANFSLYWGLSIMLYEASLVSNDSPFDRMMNGKKELVEKLWCDKKGELGPIYIDRLRTSNPKPDGEAQFLLKSGSEVFQRGFRVFMSRGCIDCHDGPLMSELYGRMDFAEEKPPIARAIAHTLLTNSRGDAIAIAIREEHDRMITRVADLLARTVGANHTKQHAERVAVSLENLVDRARGQESALEEIFKAHFTSPGFLFPGADPKAIAHEWIAYGKNAVRHSGDRTFFKEEERVPHAALLVEPVSVEQMPIPPNLRPFRRTLPIQGAPSSDSYAFYDLAFYNLGVSPPRFDRGNGDSFLIDVDDRPAPAVALAAAEEIIDAIVPAEPEDLKTIEDQVREKVTSRKGFYLTREGMEKLAAAKGRVKDAYPKGSAAVRELSGAIRRRGNDDRSRTGSGTPGQANRIRRAGSPPPAILEAAALAPAGGPETIERDLSWFRDLARWDADFPPAPPAPAPQFKSVDKRRMDVFFYSRARRLAQDESPTGHRKPLLHDNELAFWGAFKTPTLRNVELTPPYMHNGRILSLFDVLDFYNRGGDVGFDRELNPDKHPEMIRLHLTQEDKLAVVFFLMSLTDDRVRREAGPFDHPSITLINGYKENYDEKYVTIPAVGEGGNSCSVNRTFPRGD